MAASFLVTPTVVTTTFPAIPAGNNRKACLVVSRVQGGGSAALPTTRTIGGQSAAKQGGFPDGSFSRLTSAVYALTEAQIQAMSGSTISLAGGNFGGQLLLAFVLQDVEQEVPVNSAYKHNPVAVTGDNVSLTRVDDSITFYGILIPTVTTPTMTNPSADGNQTGSGAQFTYGYQDETSNNTSNASYTSSSQLSGQIAVNFAPFVALPAIVSINGETEPPVPVNTEQTGIVVVTENLGTIELVQIGIGFPYQTASIVSTGVNTVTINMPELYDGIPWGSLPTEATLFVWDDADMTDPFRFGEMVIAVNTLEDYTLLALSGVSTADPDSLGAQIQALGLSVADYNQLHYPTMGGDLVLYSDLFADVAAAAMNQPILMWHVDNGSGEWNSFEVTFVVAEDPPTPGGAQSAIIRMEVIRMETVDLRLIAAELIQ